jgi:hypothetical protein
MKDVVLQLVPAGTITGRITDIDGEALPNVNVQALRYVYREGERVLQSVQQARTNDLGEYRLFWLNPGQYYVSATYNQNQQMGIVGNSPVAGPGIGGALGGRGARGIAGGRGVRGGEVQAGRGGGGQRAAVVEALAGMMSEPSEDEGYIPMYYPNTADATQAAAINLQPGITYPNVDLTISPVRTLRVRGQVIDGTTGQPAPNTQVALLPRREGIGFGMNQNLRGRNTNEGFEIRGVVPGSYDVMAMMNNRNARMTARVPIEVGAADVNNVTLVLSPGFTLAGRIMIEGRPPGSGDPELTRMRINLRPIGGPGGPLGGPPPAGAAQPNGTFTLERVGQGDYRVAVSGMPQGHYVKIARLGSIDALDQGLRITEQPSVPLDILISPNTAKLDGSVSDGKQQPSINVTVVLVPDGAFRTRRISIAPFRRT